MERRIRQLLHRKNLDFKSFCAELARNEAAKEEFLNYLTINTSGFSGMSIFTATWPMK